MNMPYPSIGWVLFADLPVQVRAAFEARQRSQDTTVVRPVIQLSSDICVGRVVRRDIRLSSDTSLCPANDIALSHE